MFSVSKQDTHMVIQMLTDMDLEEVIEIHISQDGWVHWWGDHEAIQSIAKEIGEREFKGSSEYCG